MPTPAHSNVSATLEQILPAPVRARIARLAPFLLLLGLLVLCGYLAARLSWQFAAPGPVGSPALAGAPSESANGGLTETPGEKIAAAHLFGTAAAPAASVAARNAPETSLDLSLSGVAASNEKTRSYAIIANGGSHDVETYAAGATLPGGALIREILPDRVILAHDGRLETLRLPMAGTSILAAQAISGPGANAGTRRALPGIAPANLRNQLQHKPRSLSQYMRLRPYSEKGHLVGYRVYPGEKPELFRKAGLVPGDVVTSVNGITLNNPANSMKAVHELREAQGPVRLVILRKGHRTVVTINTGG